METISFRFLRNLSELKSIKNTSLLRQQMEAKQAESSSQCMYCIANQRQICGHRPLRCVLCKYTATSKGNLGIHMKSDKHIRNVQKPENREMVTAQAQAQAQAITQQLAAQLAERINCIYCITNQEHPRLAQGKSYTCGYKPFGCEVCDYGTVKFSNLSIHMQSDKHINNVQELQNGGVVTVFDGTKIYKLNINQPNDEDEIEDEDIDEPKPLIIDEDASNASSDVSH